MKYLNFLILILLFLLNSCEFTESTETQNQLSLSFYGQAEGSLDSLFVTRNGGLAEQISFKNLSLSGVRVFFYEDNLLVDTLKEYSERKGVYYLPKDNNFVFKIGKKYRVEAKLEGYPIAIAETVCPDTLKGLEPNNMMSGVLLNSKNSVDTIIYKPGYNFLDGIYVEAEFDNSLMSGKRLGIFEVNPEHKEKEYWLEDTTSTVWDDYQQSIQFLKRKEQYGRPFYYWFDQALYVNWLAFYSRGLNFVRFGSMDEARRNFLVGANDPSADLKGNVVNGNGLFTISSYNKKVYKIFVK